MEMIGDPDPKKVQRVMETMFQMKKIDIEKIEQAYILNNHTDNNFVIFISPQTLISLRRQQAK